MELSKEKLALFLEKHTYQEAAEYFKVSKRTIERRIRQYKFKRRGANKLNLEIAREIRKSYYNGETQMTLANTYNVSQGAIQKIVNNISYKEKTFSFKGTSATKVKFYGN